MQMMRRSPSSLNLGNNMQQDGDGYGGGFNALRGSMPGAMPPPATPNILAAAMPSPPSDVRGGSMQAAALQPSLPPLAQAAPLAGTPQPPPQPMPMNRGSDMGGDGMAGTPHDLAMPHPPHVMSPMDGGQGTSMQAGAGPMMAPPSQGPMRGLQQLQRRPMGGPGFRGMPQL